jgi:TonB family protein
LNRNRIVSLAALSLMMSLSALPARAGNFDGVISSEYPTKIVTLRHFYSGDRLRFYADGTLVEDAPAGTFTTDGQVEVRAASLDHSVLTIKARRIYQVYDSRSRQFVDALTTVGNLPDKQQKEVEKALRKRQVIIEIQMSGDPDPKEVPEVLHAVFLAPDEPVTKITPVFYRDYFAKLEGNSTPPQLPPGVVRLASVHGKPGEISAPHATFSPDPEYSEAGRQLKYQGTMLLSLIVDPSGSARDIQITQPLGAGLDDQAIAAVSQWKFQPAEKDGKPVPVAISVEVNFRIH